MSILWFSDEKRVPKVNDEIFSNLNIDKLLNYKTLSVLSLYCTNDELIGRSKIFDRLLNDNLSAIFYQLKSSLADLESCFYIYDKSTNQLERVFRARMLYYSYKHVCDLVFQITVKDEVLLNNFKNDVIAMSQAIIKAESFVKSSEDQLSSITKARVRVGSGSAVAASNGSDSKLGKLIELIKGIGVDIDFSKIYSRSLKINDHFASSYCNAYSDKIKKLEQYPKLIATLNRKILAYRDEIEFYLSIYELVMKAKANNISYALPSISTTKCFLASGVYDISLLAENVGNIVPNDVFLSQDESVFFIIGANGGGKTSYLRSVALNSVFATAGCPIFAKDGKIFNFKKIYTHFPSDEDSTDVGRFVEEKQRIDSILAECTQDTLLFMNETFSGTDNAKGSAETLKIAESMQNLGCMGLIVTHFNDIPFEKVPVLSAIVEYGKRTFTIKRHDTKIIAHAKDVLEKYGLTQESIEERFLRRNVQ